MLRNVLLEQCLADNRGSDLHHFARENASEKMYVCAVTSPHTDTIAEVHDRLCAADDHFLFISAHLDHYRSRGSRTT